MTEPANVCGCCQGPLAPGYRGTCEACVAEAQVLLSGIRTMYFSDAPMHLGQPRGGGFNDRPTSADGRPLPGGDLLVLLGNGSQGLAEDGETSRDDDPSSVAFDLGYWEKVWREWFQEPSSNTSHRPNVIVREAARYLERRSWSASQQHSAFGDYLDDLRLLHGRLQRATGLAMPRSRANAACFDCGGRLVRRLKEVTVARWWLPGKVGPLPAIVKWFGEVEELDCACDRCGREYTQAQYNLALAAEVERASQLEVDGEMFGTLTVAAKRVDRAEQTIRNWLTEGLLRRTSRAGVTFVSLADVDAVDATKARRRRTAS